MVLRFATVALVLPLGPFRVQVNYSEDVEILLKLDVDVPRFTFLIPLVVRGVERRQGPWPRNGGWGWGDTSRG
jgi:hypothetical protein